MSRARLVLAGFAVVLIGAIAPAAAAEPAAHISVSPSDVLMNGQTVTVQGAGFAFDALQVVPLLVALCPADVLSNIATAPTRCGATVSGPSSFDASGTFVAQLQVFISQPTFQG